MGNLHVSEPFIVCKGIIIIIHSRGAVFSRLHLCPFIIILLLHICLFVLLSGIKKKSCVKLSFIVMNNSSLAPIFSSPFLLDERKRQQNDDARQNHTHHHPEHDQPCGCGGFNRRRQRGEDADELQGGVWQHEGLVDAISGLSVEERWLDQQSDGRVWCSFGVLAEKNHPYTPSDSKCFICHSKLRNIIYFSSQINLLHLTLGHSWLKWIIFD